MSLASRKKGKYALAGTITCFSKEQYAVTAHAPNCDFWTGYPEIKRCEESKRTLKNPFASRLAEFNTTLKIMGSALKPIEGLFLMLASIQTQIIVKGIHRNETATIKTCGIKLREGECFATTRW